MKKLILLTLGCCMTMLTFGQDLLSTDPEPRNVILEEFTGLNCTFCPDGHARASALAEENPGDVILVNIHTGGFANPGAGQPDYRTQWGPAIDDLVDVQGYPAGTINRLLFEGQDEIALSRTVWAAAAESTLQLASPVNLGMSTSFNDTSRELTVYVELYYTDNSPMPENFLNIALLESGVIGYQLNAGVQQFDYEHNHMLRDFLTGQWGDTIPTTTLGSTWSNTYTYVVSEDFNIENCDVAAYVAESKLNVYTGEEVNAIDGTTVIIGKITDNEDSKFKKGAPTITEALSFDLENGFPTEQSFIFSLNGDLPDGWTAQVGSDGDLFDLPATLSLDSSEIRELTFEITPGEAAAIASVSLNVASAVLPGARTLKFESNIISNVQDLVISNSGAEDFASIYADGLTVADRTQVASTSSAFFLGFDEADALDDVENLYYNVGWTFPALSNNMLPALTEFLDNGGNMFIAGQDIGWDAFDPNGNGTPEVRAFYTNYLHANYDADGTSINALLNALDDDHVYGDVENSGFNQIYDTNLFPEEISPADDDAVAAFQYGIFPNGKTAGIRAQTENYKVVYLGVGLEQLSFPNVVDDLLKQTSDWFEGLLATDDLLVTQFSMFPNPVTEILTIELSDTEEAIDRVEIIDITGKQVGLYDAPSTNFNINVSNIPNGMYLVRLQNELGQTTRSQKISITK